MDTTHLVLLFLAIGVIALLYSSVGHAGASGYIATMTLFGIAPTVIRPTALVLNILVASIGTFQFWRAGYFSWNLFWPFALLSIPAAYLGGYLQPSASVLKILIGVVLLLSAARLLVRRSDPQKTSPPSQPVAISVGAALGFLAGLTGTGGGIFLTPVLLFCRWAHIRQAAAVSALFIWVNSIGWLLHKSTRHSFARTHSRGGGNYWRHYRLASGEQAFCGPRNFALPRNSAGDCRNQIDLHEVAAIAFNRPGGSGEPPLPYRNCSFGAVSGVHGLIV